MTRWNAIFAAFLLLLTTAIPSGVFAARGTQTAPRLLNLYLGWQIKDADVKPLTQWDLVVLDMDMQWQSPEIMQQLRRENPRLKIIAYVSAGELATARANGDKASPGYRLSQLVSEAHFMHRADGRRLAWWPGAELMNATNLGPVVNGRRWEDVLPAFVRDELMVTGLWDGVFLDAAYSDLTHFFGTDIDPDGDARANSSAQTNAAYQAGMRRLIRNMRTALGPNKIIMNNSSPAYASDVNGVLFENFPRYGWTGPFRDFRDTAAKNERPSVAALNTNTDNRETPADYRLMRYGLASALLVDGYYSFDAGDRGHERTWWYDEYDASLGTPKSAARLISGTGPPAGGGVVTGVWMREYERGIVLVNSGTTPRKVSLPGTFERLRGGQDPRTNNGALVRTVDMPSQDGLILLGQTDATEVRDGAFTNGEFLRVYSLEGVQVRNGFFAQRSDVPNGAAVVLADLARNGATNVVSANAGAVRTDGVTFRPFGTSYAGKLSLAVGNTNRDAPLEIIVGRDKAKPSDVRVYSRTGALLARWIAYNPAFAGGVRVAIGDLDGDGLREVVTGAGPGGGPHIRIFKTDGKVWGGSFFAFDQNERGGVSVAVGDVDGDAKDEIIVGSGEGAVPRVRVFDFRGTLKQEFTLGTNPLLQGLTVTASDVNGDGKKDILVAGIPAF